MRFVWGWGWHRFAFEGFEPIKIKPYANSLKFQNSLLCSSRSDSATKVALWQAKNFSSLTPTNNHPARTARRAPLGVAWGECD